MQTIEYIILTVGNYSDSQLETISSKCVSPISTARYNNDNTKCIIKVYILDLPDFCDSLTRYSATEIRSKVEEAEWQNPTDPSSAPEYIPAPDDE